ncbi:galactosylgalactosylxylosylprotein 3-beta-glucuronosyltransferase 3-like [Dreissena polymorpha]|uniref:Galactosylgalactosylxylosylprotein 3-beta-glucuronosyltransferase n=1 Tax=Dreissena polymorpha TaxID=45954 RepID=A0A9D4R183_DREPO|nr:galactosylgalactosylxylosylprotein 3-beta-glucuronosyltransferase 3-like [Dreissena polymorpha]XP_052275157.1 galactosylgalactosylxylosylprotein 3-beta-glucuronosyltransferase 3-like [Dreissena polymorpha]XP_052275158.1 galactosylgalactosylxylosylprotein 3-beta-glucuronosyltransferase 3-like [Dreissena polymorpha]KAH3851204.1 hypothetical protein DPMN_093683 [Dreissena polymorpha]
MQGNQCCCHEQLMMIRQRLIYIYFAGTGLALFWIFVNFGTWCEDNSDYLELEKKKVQLLQQKTDTQRLEIDVLKRLNDDTKLDLTRAEKKLNSLVINNNKDIPVIYLITPTHGRLEQKADLTRLSYTLRLVPNIHWIIVEDLSRKSDLVTNFLANCKLPYTHLFVATPDNYKLKEKDPNWLKPRGVLQRNKGLQWLRNQTGVTGVVYFADDDNTYDLRIFEEMRYTQRVSVWPVGLVGDLKYESPKLRNKKVVGWHTYWKPERKFAMDMAGFAINARLLLEHPRAEFRMTAGRGNLESDLLTQLGVEWSDLEPRAEDCTKVLVWHTRTEKSSLKNEGKMKTYYNTSSDINIEV